MYSVMYRVIYIVHFTMYRIYPIRCTVYSVHCTASIGTYMVPIQLHKHHTNNYTQKKQL